MKQTILAYTLCLLAMAFLGYFELHTDDTGVEVVALVFLTFTLGCIHPRNAWQWGLLVGAAIPAAELLFGHDKLHGSLAGVSAFVLAIGIAASYMGAAVRKMLATETRRHGENKT